MEASLIDFVLDLFGESGFASAPWGIEELPLVGVPGGNESLLTLRPNGNIRRLFVPDVLCDGKEPESILGWRPEPDRGSGEAEGLGS